LAFDECAELLVDNGVTKIDGLLVEFVATDSVGCFLLDCDEDEPVDAGDALIPSRLDMIAKLSATLSERRGAGVLGCLEVDDVVLADPIETSFDLDTGPLSEIADLSLDSIQ